MGLLDTLKGLFGGKAEQGAGMVTDALSGTPLQKVGDMVDAAQAAVADHADTVGTVAEQIKKVTPDSVDAIIDKGTEALTGGTDNQAQK